jgi:hypothetical protein
MIEMKRNSIEEEKGGVCEVAIVRAKPFATEYGNTYLQYSQR